MRISFLSIIPIAFLVASIELSSANGPALGAQYVEASQGPMPHAGNGLTVLADPESDTISTGQPGRVLISEIMYHPFHQPPEGEDIRREYIELRNTDSKAVNMSGWRLADCVDFTFPDVTLGMGQYLVVAADVDTFKAIYPGVSNVVGGWKGKLSNSGERITLVDSVGATVDSLRYADQGDWAVRELGSDDYGHRGWVWSDEHDGGGRSLELINPEMPNQHGQNWAASSINGGTPGEVNSAAAEDASPLILDVTHRPIIPGSADPVTVSARIADESPTGVTAVVYYRRDGDTGFYFATMLDSGGDAADGIYEAEIPAQPDGTIVEFYVTATDSAANWRTWPAASLVDGKPVQATNALYQVNDSPVLDAGWAPGVQPVYNLIMTERESAQLQDIADKDYTGNLFASEAMSNAQMNATFISIDGVEINVRYGVGVRNRGNRKRADPPMSYHVNFRTDDLWKGAAALNLNSKYPHLELMGSVLCQMAGLPAANVTAVQLRVNGRNQAAGDYSRSYGAYAAIEILDSHWAENHFPNDSAGNLYRCTYYDDGVHSRTYADLDYKENPGQTPNPNDYRDNYLKKTNNSEDDWSDLFKLIDKLNDADISDADFLAEISEIVNIEMWARYLAMDALVGNREGGLTSGRGDDYAMYRGVEDPRFRLVPHDLDTVLGQGDHDYRPQLNIFVYAGVDGLKRLLDNPDFVKLYYTHYKDLIETVFEPAKAFPLIDRYLADWTPESEIEGPKGIKQFITDRANSILYGGYPAGSDPQIPRQFIISSNLPVVDGFHRTSSPLVALTGTADAIETRSITVNGELVAESDWLQRDGTWSIDNILLNPGINRVIVRAFDGLAGTGARIKQGHIDIWYDTGWTNDYPQAGDGADWAPAQTGDRTLNLIVRDSYLPGTPLLVRVEVLNDDGTVNRDWWDAVATLSVADNPGVSLSTKRVALYNGLGSAPVTVTGSSAFTLIANVNGLEAAKVLVDWSHQPIYEVSGGIARSQTWEGIYRITGGDFTIPAGVVLTLSAGTLVLIDGVSSGSGGTDVDVAGSIQSLGTADSPVTITAFRAGENWGELHHENAGPSTFRYTNITQAGRSPRVGHSNSGPAIRASNSAFVFDHSSLTDNAGKLMHVTSGSDLEFHNCLFARSIMGPEISRTALLFENSWITEMHANDDGDGIYINGQQAAQQCTLVHCVAANIDDDGIDTLNSDVTIHDCIVRDCRDKGISIYGGEVDISHCLIVENNKAPEDPTVATIAAKTVNGATAVVNIDHSTIVTWKTPGVLDVAIQSHNKYGVTSGKIIYNVTNSIIDATDPVDVQAPYLESDIFIDYSNVFGETWPGTGNLNTDPVFVDPAQHDYRLRENSPSIDAGDPAADPDPDMTTTDQGYGWQGPVPHEPSTGSLPAGTVWTSQDGPYRITGDLTVPPGSELMVMPGTTVFFDPGATLIVKGRLIAEGAEYEQIRFTQTPGTSGGWDGLQFVETLADNQIIHAVVEYGRTNNGMINLRDSNLLIDCVTLDNTVLERISATNSSLIVRNSVFTDTCAEGEIPTDNRSEHIVARGVHPEGWFIIEGNIFGRTPGHNDAIDMDGPSRPAPIPQIINNIFTGGGDDALDLGSDAHIEGNIFMDYVKDEHNRASGESNAISAGAGKHYVMVRNVFDNVQHVAQVKDDAFLTFTNNTVGDTLGSAIYFDLGLPGRRPGRGAYLDGNIFSKTPSVLEGVVDTTELSVNNSLLPVEWHGFGVGNIDADPLFVDGGGDFALKAGSPAIGTGPCGLDMGALVPGGAAICGEPDELTWRTEATLFVGGPGITHYKYQLGNGHWSQETPVDTPIHLTNLRGGESYVVHVIGKNSAGVWQSETDPTASREWTVDPSYSNLRINETLAINNSILEHEGTFPDFVELYYDGPSSLSLAGMSITDDPDETDKFVFSSGTTIEPGQYLLLYADSSTTASGIHLGFALDGDGEAIYLYDKSGTLIDSIEFGTQLPDLSIGRTGGDGSWRLAVPTPGGANVAQPLGDPATLRINEWLTNGEVLFNDDFIELYNSHASPVDLSGLYLTDNPVTQPGKYRLRPLSFVAGGAFAVLKADGQDRPGHVDFRLSAYGEMIGRFAAGLNEIDKVIYGPQTTDVSQGRAPDGVESFEFAALPTPGVANPSSTATTLIKRTLVPEDADKRVLVPTYNIGQRWRTDLRYDDSDWMITAGGPGGVGYERNSGYENFISLDLETQMYGQNTSCYIRIPFNVEAEDLAGLTELMLRVRYDDGFVAYLNGIQVARGNFSGTPAWNSRTASSISDSAAVLFEDIDISAFIGNLNNGNNVLAIHGLNASPTSSDMLISVRLDAAATAAAQEFPFVAAMELLDGLRVTELMYHASQGSNFDYIELQNIGDDALDLTGVRLNDGVDFTFGPMILDPGRHVVVVDNLASFRSAYGTGIDIAGEYSGSLSNGGEQIVLQLPKPLDAAILRFAYSDKWHPATDGGGSALEIKNPLAHPATWNDPESWRTTMPSPGR